MYYAGWFRLLSVMLAGVMTACGGGSQADAGAALLCASCPAEQSGGSSSSSTGVGSGGGGSTSAGGIEGYWQGTGGGYEFGAVVLGDRATFVAYSRAGVIEGLMVGIATASDANFSAAVTDYNGARLLVTRGTLQGTYFPKLSMSAAATLGSLNVPFTATYDPVYDTAVDMVAIAGTWSGTAASRDGMTTARLDLAADGAFTGSTPFCSVSGTLVPISAGKHPLQATVNFSGARCPLSGRTVSGVAIVSQTSGRTQLLAAGVLADATDGFFALLTR